MKRLLSSLLSFVLSVSCLPSLVHAQAYPAKPVRVIIVFPPGGSNDVVGRIVFQKMSDQMGQQFVIENRGGAAGTLGPAHMSANTRPDGYTVAQIPITVFRLPFMRKTSFDPTKDFTYIIGLTGYTFGVVVRKDAPWKTFQELLADAKANPGKINYGTPGAGTSLHITMEQIAKLQGSKWTHVPFKGNAEATTALLGGHIQVLADSTGWAQLVNTGELRLLVTWGAGRTKNWPNVPTLKEVGIDIVSNSPFGIAGPPGMDPAVVKVLHDAFKKGMEDPSYIAAMERFDQEPFYLNSADYHAYAMGAIAQEKRLVEELGLKAD